MKTFLMAICLFGLSHLIAQDQVSSEQVMFEKAQKEYKTQADEQIEERLNLLKKLELLNAEALVLEKEKEQLLKTIEKQISTKQNIKGNLDSFQNQLAEMDQKSKQAIIDHNYNRPLSYLGASDLTQKITDSSITAFFKQITKEEAAASEINKNSVDVISSNNQVIKEDVIVVGNIGAYSITNHAHLLLLKSDTLAKVENIAIDQILTQNLKQLKIEGLPFDVTGGEALLLQQEEPNIWQRIQNGGYIVYPILFIGMIAFCIIIFKFLSLTKNSTKILSLEAKIQKASESQDWQNLEASLHNQQSLAHQLVQEGLTKKNTTKKEFTAFMEETIYAKIPKLEMMMPTLNILGVISPLLGLLGTVSGMIATFDIISIHGAGDPGLLSKGISEALITTQLGLMVAVPIVLIHSLLTSKVERIINDLEMVANTMISSFYPSIENEAKK